MALHKKILVGILIYVHILAIDLSIFPIGIRTLFSVCTVILLLTDKLKLSYLTKYYKQILLLLLLWGLITFISTYGNESGDYYFVILIVSQINSLLASLFVAYIITKYLHGNSIISYCAFIIAIFCLSGILMYFNPNIRDLLLSISQIKTIRQYEVTKIVESFRFIGFGPTFFGAGVYSGLGLILLVFVIIESNGKYKVYYTSLYILILFGGIFASRTTIIGFIISLMMFLLYGRMKKTTKIVYISVIIAPIIIISVYLFYNYQNFENQSLIKFGFEYIFNYEQNGELSDRKSVV